MALSTPALQAFALERARRAFFRYRSARRAALLAMYPRLREGTFDLAHLPFFREESAIGPVQRDEALALHAITRVLRPAVIVEVGFLGGMSSLNFLTAMEPDAHLYSFDINHQSEEVARTSFSDRGNFTFQRKSQDEITIADVGGRPVDLLFLDASHELSLNMRTFEHLHGLMADDGIFIIHDTGAWHRDLLLGSHRETADAHPYGWAGDMFQHQAEEREFVNWILEAHPEYAQIHFHSRRTLRHGMTLLQRSRPLATNAGLSAQLRADAGLPAAQSS